MHADRRHPGNHRLEPHRTLGNMGVDEFAAHHCQRRPAGCSCDHRDGPVRAVPFRKTPSWTASNGATELAASRIMSMPKPASYSPCKPLRTIGEQPGNMVRIAGGAAGIDRQGHDLVVDPIEEQMKACAPSPSLSSRMPSWMARSCVVINTSSISPIGSAKPPFGIAFGHRQARRHALFEIAIGLIDTLHQRAPNRACNALRLRPRNWPICLSPIWVSPAICIGVRRNAATDRPSSTLPSDRPAPPGCGRNG